MEFLERAFTNIDGMRCAFHRAGVGAPLTLIHGWGQSADMWQNVIPHLSEHFTVYALDLPGFGWSDAPDNEWRVEDFVCWLHAFVVHHALEKATVLGHSFGGRVALAYATAYKTEQLILYNTSNLRTFSLFRMLNILAARTFMHLAPKFLWRVHTTMLKPRSYSNRVKLTSAEAVRMLATFICTHKKPWRPPTAPLTESILCIAGTHDHIVDPRIAHRYAVTLPHATLATLDGGHFAHIDNPEAFCHVLEQFCMLKNSHIPD